MIKSKPMLLPSMPSNPRLCSAPELVYPGIWKIRIGENPDAFTPVNHRVLPAQEEGLCELPVLQERPLDCAKIHAEKRTRGLLLELPLGDEEVYGFGLQLKSFCQSGKKKTIRVNSDPVSDTGDSHAPVPFYVTSAGYGVLVDTARYASFYIGSHQPPGAPQEDSGTGAAYSATGTAGLYSGKDKASNKVVVDIPFVEGVDVYLFGGPTMLDAVRRYILFSGGGCLPPFWGLGVWYRTFGQFNQQEVLDLARQLRESKVPCDVLGLEPGWQSQAYSCSYRWNPKNFASSDALISELHKMGFDINLWEHGFVHPTSPIYRDLLPFSGDNAVWKGLVPDFSVAKAREIFAGYHESALIQKGIGGFKLDECDNSDFIASPWSFPEHSQFPSGMDGEQMHSLFGTLYAQTVWQAFRKNDQRTLSQVRAGHALSAPLPFVLYSDLYDQADFLRGVVNSGFSGQLWSPEVRQCASVEDLFRRLQMVMFSPHALINAWMVPIPPWRQFDEVKNRAGELHADWETIEAKVRELFEFRTQLVPYLYSAFADYHFQGIPVCRPLVMDHPEDPEVRAIDDQYLLGPNLLVAPMLTGQTRRRIYLPEGEWVAYHSSERFDGKQWIKMDADLYTIPLFVKSGTLLPLAQPMTAIGHDPRFVITVKVFGSAATPFRLFADDGVTFGYEKGQGGWIELAWDGQQGSIKADERAQPDRYTVQAWEVI